MNEPNGDLKADEDDGNWEYLEKLLQNIRDGKTSPTPTNDPMKYYGSYSPLRENANISYPRFPEEIYVPAAKLVSFEPNFNLWEQNPFELISTLLAPIQNQPTVSLTDFDFQVEDAVFTLNKMAEIKKDAELKEKLSPNPVKSAGMNYCEKEPKGLIQRCAKCFAHNIISRNLKSHREICTFNDCKCHQCKRIETIRNASSRYRNKKRVHG